MRGYKIGDVNTAKLESTKKSRLEIVTLLVQRNCDLETVD